MDNNVTHILLHIIRNGGDVGAHGGEEEEYEEEEIRKRKEVEEGQTHRKNSNLLTD